MKIGILTQALHSNYGGLLQNYALQTVLRQMGHEAITIDRHIPRNESLLKNFVKRVLQILKPSFDVSLLTPNQKSALAKFQQDFVQNNISRTEKIFTQESFDRYVKRHPMDAYIVGSDQCWRPCYSANIFNYYLDFVKVSAKKIAYAASFGVDVWEYSDKQTDAVNQLAKQFDAISVRERSGQDLCREKLGVDAAWVLDPTMLLGKDGFERFITKEETSGYVLDYHLEESEEARLLVQKVCKNKNIKFIRSNIASPVFHRFESVMSHQNKSIEQWLSNIYNASFVVTDSFHGAVFCILFNVPFVVKLNKIRGNARLESLLGDFGLLDCIFKDMKVFKLPTFDWGRINAHLSERRKESLLFLENALR